MQALEFEVAARAGIVQDAGECMRVMRCELRIDRTAGSEGLARTGKIGNIGMRLAREYRVTPEAEFLRVLDLGIPVCALDEPHRDAPAAVGGQADEEVEHAPRAALVCLYGQPQAFIVAQRVVAIHALEYLQGDLEPFALLGVHGHGDAAVFCV